MQERRNIRSRGRKKENEVYRIAASLFNKQGYASTSIRKICQTIGIRESSLYYYMRSKEELLYNICEWSMIRSLEAVEPIVMSNIRPDLKLRKIIETHIITIAQNVNEHSTMLKELRSLSPKNQRKIINLRDRYETLCRKVLADYAKENSCRRVNVKIITLALLGMMNWLIHWYSAGGEMKSDEIAKIFSNLFIHGACQVLEDGESYKKLLRGLRK